MGTTVEDNKENLKMCACSDCPTFRNSPLSGALYCAKGKADGTPLESGCMCSHCPVADKYDLILEYFCVRGKSVDIP